MSLFDDFEVTESIAKKEVASAIKSDDEIRAEWHQKRRGVFTASQAYRLMGYENREELQDGGKTYAKEKAAELLTAFNPERSVYKSASMQWGNDHESEALTVFHESTGIIFDKTGVNQDLFISVISPWIGATPDGVNFEQKIGIEIKCPDSNQHFDYLQIKNQDELKTVCKDYYWQIQQEMFCTGFEQWYFVSYDPDFDKKHRLKILQVERCEGDINRLLDRSFKAIAYRDKLIKYFK